MVNRRSDTSLTSRYDEFLFASICEDANGMRLSVVSALARMNIDPWEEATRLAAMPRGSAERTLVSTLGVVSDRSWDPSEAESIAARLVGLLPPAQQSGRMATAATDTAGIGGQRIFYWMMLLALAMSLLSQQHAKTDAGASPPTSGESSQMNSDGLIGSLPRSQGQPR